MAGIAIVGMSCRFPGATNIDEFWEMLIRAEPQFSEVPRSRWDHSAYYRPGDFREPHSVYTDQVAFLSEVDQFAPAHYGIPPRRARTMDPQAKLFVDLAREALQDAGWERDGFDRASTGVFAGVTSLDHRDVSVSRISANLLADGSLHDDEGDPELMAALHDATGSSLMPMNPFTIPGCLANMVPCTVSEVFDLGGPSLSVDAACSSALVALDAAVRSLRSGACSTALVGGVYLSLSPTPLVGFARSGALSRDGVCRPFDERADGFVLGEGGALLVLRPLEDAVAAGDRIYAVVTGVGSANDGKGGGPMTPQVTGQLAALRAAYRDAGISPGEIDLLEAHGTGTPVGDRTEIEAIRLLRAESGQAGPCYVGSSKALIGHTLSAAGAAGLVKAALAIHHGVVPPQPAEHRVNDALALGEASLRLTTEQRPWPREGARRAAVSSFGFGGTNVHAVLEGTPTEPADQAEESADTPWLFLLSAGSVPLLARHAAEVRDDVAAAPEATPAAVARTLAARELLTARLAVVAATREELLDRLDVAARRLAEGGLGELAPGIHAADKPLPPEERKVAFAFPGQGSQHPGMLADLVRRFPVLAERAAELTALMADQNDALPDSLAELLWEREPDDAEAQAALMVTDMCQPSLGICGVATTELLAACGVEPDLAVGHSVGEFPAAVAAGAFAGPDAVAFMARRGAALAAAVPPGTGAMLAVQAPVTEAERVASAVEGVWPACYNHKGQLVFSGSVEAVDRLRAHCAKEGVAAVRLKVSHAFHSPLVAAADEAMAETIASLPLTGPTRAFVSSVSGLTCEQPDHIRELWARHNTAPVRFTRAVRSVTDAGVRFLVQIYGGDTLLRMARQDEAGTALTLLPLTANRPDGGRALLTALGRLAVAGVPVDPAPLFARNTSPLLSLPVSPLETAAYTVRTGGDRKRPATSPGAAPAAAPVPSIRTVIPSPVPTHPIGEPRMSGLIELMHAQLSLLQSCNAAADATGEPHLDPAAEERLIEAALAPRPAQHVLVAEPVRVRELPKPADEAAVRVFAAISKVSAYSEDFLRAEHVFATDLGFDSIMLADLTARLRKEWPGLEVHVADVVNIATIGELIATVQSRFGSASAAPSPGAVAAVASQSTAAIPAQRAHAPAASAAPAEAVRPAVDREQTADVRVFPEVLASLERSRVAEQAGVRNPYFLPHEGTIRDTTRVDGEELISFSSYNYLGLSGHPMVAEAIREAVERYGSSVSAARILSGNRPLHEELDRALADLIGAEDALTLVSGHATNVTVIGHLMGPDDLIVHDALAHDSILQGCRQSGAARQPFPHNDTAALDRILTNVRDRYRRVLIVVEGVYSMDGDTADLAALIAVKQKHDALLMVDEAHSIGVMGKTGGGMAQHSGVTPEDVDVWMGTLSKSLASCGGYVAGRHELIQHFRYTLPGFVFSAGLPPASTAAALAALRLIREEPERVTRLHDNSALFLRLASEARVEVGTSGGTPIVPCITGDSMKALHLADRLYNRGISANPILHPAVEERLARLRFFITSEHTEEQITATIQILAEELARPF
ncbi:aminotransferase class I/II-fold pyridoxal phosphate-dependent enzyme [Streptomyces sp. NBC_00842]|uniref:aminotransferase class I/II-fold pyridoxal phosphate-dependent enzyme n=1 Tax=Streptomyces sp. NBC_00842 TaxID=2975848 RepID=UPI003868DA20|nr:aminotransferase class I/II-fold pyridoxal phosphate-dependent enzyme [Streptomyces sp. NBC_00842]WTA48406.1 aminotransferase class I/II-fold pyridoxal phosphate-dependent enzyme [Streptomyces sp. NBC_00842]